MMLIKLPSITEALPISGPSSVTYEENLYY